MVTDPEKVRAARLGDVQRQLADLHAKLLGVLEDLPEPYVITDRRGSITEANDSAAELLAVDLHTVLLGRLLIAFVARQDTRTFRSAHQQLVEEGDASAELGTRLPAGCVLVVRMRPRRRPVLRVEATGRIVRSGSGETIALRWLLHPAANR
jgi:PAS domain-containing protein